MTHQPKRSRYYTVWRRIVETCGFTGTGKALFSFPAWELVGVVVLLVLFGWKSNFNYAFGVVLGFVLGVQVGKRIQTKEAGGK